MSAGTVAAALGVVRYRGGTLRAHMSLTESHGRPGFTPPYR